MSGPSGIPAPMNKPASLSLSAVVEAHYEELRAFVLLKVGCPAMAADVVQETWLKVAVQEPAEPVQNARAYLYRVAGNLAIDRLRQETSRARHMVQGPLPEGVPSAAPGADQILSGRQEFDILSAAIRELPEKCRAVFLLYRAEGYTMRQIAIRLGISEKTVEKHVAKAMLHCRARLRASGRQV